MYIKDIIDLSEEDRIKYNKNKCIKALEELK